MLRNLPFVAAATLLLAASSCSSPSSIGCESDTQCRSGRVCIDGKCQSPGGGGNNSNVDMGNNGQNVITVNNQNNPQNNPPNNLNNPPNNLVDPDYELCTNLCNLFLGTCIEQVCDLQPDQRAALDEYVEICMFVGFEEDEPGCIEALQTQPGYREEVEAVLGSYSCEGEELEEFRCTELDLGEACGCDPVLFNDIGDSCTGSNDCNGGGLPGICADEDNQPPFPDGYCLAFGCPIDPDDPEPHYSDICGIDNVCIQAGDTPDQGLCLDGCFSHGECRPGYQCRLMGADREAFEPIRVCLPECTDTLRCQNPEERCNEGRCELPCTDNPNRPNREICEGLGFECVPDADGSEWCQTF